MPNPVSVEDSFAHCRGVARKRARNFYYAFMLLPRERKDAMCAIYAFMRYADDISDELHPPVETRRRALDAWKIALERALEGEVGDDKILPAFAATVKKYSIPPEYFFDLIEGVGKDLSPQRYRTFQDLYRYCYQVASVVGLTTIHVFGFDGRGALDLAEKCGVAFQLTNILRDIPEDAGMGRVYLPEEDLARFGLSRQDLIERRGGDRLRELIRFEWDRAQGYYQEAAPLLGMVKEPSQPALWAMIAIYCGILGRIRSLGYDVYRTRPSLSDFEKTRIVLRAMRKRLFGGALPYPA